ncbi:probable G-protein coupled receptor 174 [Callorhinchus milii]|uniref:Putative purinergic receptor FKSG79 n=1 Tax=Callorhinchus milii TaxID=7868 RepID=V9KSV1_CALMI|nr:probable G-protein coupled receptor 174 [Callorhinchus milii]XP_007890371.1 probable G-protein coupled receptor 174 [Callorhinchus milii]|eukprot:gi/632935511/ref/XP_007890362.1/ PREDICTED: probable G-protein coupled receptor 174 [Callorhinchus milii]
MMNNTSIAICLNSTWENQFTLYAVIYGIITLPGIFGNMVAFVILFKNIKREKKAVIFMLNLVVADLAHALSLPLRIFYYLSHNWPFGHFMCLFCFYLKYLNMYASIYFLVCISIQRCVFLLYPFKYRSWKRRYDVALSAVGWMTVMLICLTFPIMRNISPFNSSQCFADLPTRKIKFETSIAMLIISELMGFILPLIIILTCTWKTVQSLKSKQNVPHDQIGKKALKMVLMCATVFLICFAPYHLFFGLNLLKSNITDCSLRKTIIIMHSVTLCLASMNCCLDPIIYYFVTAEFREQLSRTGSYLSRSRHLSSESTTSHRLDY